MGASESKNPDQEVEERVHEPYLIQWDQHGHLRYGKPMPPLLCALSVLAPNSLHPPSFLSIGEPHKVDPGRQMVEIMELDYVDDIVSINFFLPFLVRQVGGS